MHLRTPGQEYKEDLDTGTSRRRRGRLLRGDRDAEHGPDRRSPLRCCGSLIAARQIEARVPVGFLAAITRGLDGEELTEMAELRDAGALGFTDDGKPVVVGRYAAQALQYQRLCGGVIALHEEDPALSGDGVMHEGAVSAALGLAGIPSLISESTMIARDACPGSLRGGARCTSSTSPRVESVEALAHAKAAGARVSGEVTPHHLTLTDDVVRDARHAASR